MRAVGLGSALVLTIGLWGAVAATSDDEPAPLGPWRSSYLEFQLEQERLRAEEAEGQVELLEAEIRSLEREVNRLHAVALRQEEAFQNWVQVLGNLAPELAPAAEAAAVDAGLLDPDEVSEPPAEAEPEADPADHPELKRAAELAGLLRGLLRSEEISGLDLLEPGRFAEGKLGPVVFRTLDDRGRLTGSISAETLHLEAGLAARTVTLVLTDGREVAGGRETPFSELRLPFVRVDPRPWLDAIPELFADAAVLDSGDDGTYDVEALRARLNLVLGRDAAAGFHRLRHLGGVRDGTLLDLHLVEHDPDGRVLRHLFADEAILGLVDRGAAIDLKGAVSVQGERKRPFPGGRLRLYLPRADHAEWRGADLPGIPPAD